MKEYILLVMKAYNLKPNFYYDKDVSIAYYYVNDICYKAIITNINNISWEINLSSTYCSILTLDFFNYEDCIEHFSLIVGENTCFEIKTLVNNLNPESKTDTLYTEAPCSQNYNNLLNYDRL